MSDASTADPQFRSSRELTVVVAVGDAQLRELCVAASVEHPHLRLVADAEDIADPRLREIRPDLVVVGGHERSAHGITAIAVARDLFPEALVLPITGDDEPSRILALAARIASEPPGDSALTDPAPSSDAIRAAIAAGDPSMVFQPVVDLQDRRVIGVEALARLRFGPALPPDAWFAAAERAGLGLELERVAVRKAIAAAEALPRDVYLAVNVSPALVLAPDLDGILAGAPAGQLVLEITEHAQVVDYDALQAALRSIRGRGVRIAIDDVGAGFASLRHVLRLDPEIIKLDHEITNGVEHDAGRAKLVGGLIAGASAVSTIVVAEGIETEAQLHRLRELGVRGGQGYYIGRPTDLRSAIESGSSTVAALDVGLGRVPAPKVPRRALSGARVLVVDDSRAHRELIRAVFEFEGAAVHEADSAAAALRALREVEPDLVLLDVRLPDGTGFDVLEQMRRTSDVPALFVTAATAVSDRVAGFDHGADDYMLKPFSPEELVARADAALRRRLANDPVVDARRTP